MAALLPVALLIAAACGGGGGTSPTPGTSTSASTSASASPADGPSDSASPSATGGDPNDLLAKVREAEKLVISTDANYKPQSFQNPDGSFEGFDIDVGREIAERLGVEAEFSPQVFDNVVAGSWNERWDMSVGSVTVTPERKDVLDFTQAYYYTPAQMGATEASGITTLEGLAGRKVCVGSSTTYQFWLEGTLTLEDAPEPAEPPEGVEPFPLETDQLCAQTAISRPGDFDGFLTSSTTLDAAIAEGAPFVPVGDPVFFESLAVAFDKNGPPHAEIQAEVDRIIAEMHEDGTLTELSEQWFEGEDLTKASE
jgi:polar amino acid transport system substrate-binding protein